jgi:hemoglobin
MKHQQPLFATIALLAAASFFIGCGSSQKKADEGFYTSGSREADQRAEQRIAKDKQIQGKGESKDDTKSGGKAPLYERLGGEKGVSAIVEDFVNRAMADPRVNWERKGVKRGGIGLHRGQSREWSASDENLANLKKHLVQFIAVATGGPPTYEGKEMKQAHSGLHISNPEFDAAVGDLKATLDKFHTPVEDQKELLAIIESTRLQVVEER